MIWHAPFSSDPTDADDNGDGIKDWAMRDTGSLPGTLGGGVWSAPGSPIRSLDSQPQQDFATRTIVDLRMRNTVRAAEYGAVFWINVDYTPTTFAPLFIVVQLQAGGTAQDVTLFGKTAQPTTVPLVTGSVVTTDFVDIRLDIDPSSDELTMTIAGVSTTVAYPSIDRAANDDRWATVLAWNGDAQFDDVHVAVCP